MIANIARWGTIPIVKIAQLEKIVEFPIALDIPWAYLQRSYGVEAESGNVTANFLHNFNDKGETVYKINVGMPEAITTTYSGRDLLPLVLRH